MLDFIILDDWKNIPLVVVSLNSLGHTFQAPSQQVVDFVLPLKCIVLNWETPNTIS